MYINNINTAEQVNFGSKNRKNKVKNKGTIRALIGGTLAGSLTLIPTSVTAANNITRPSRKLTSEQIATVNNGADKILNELTNLGKKGVKIEHYSYEPNTNINIETFAKNSFKKFSANEMNHKGFVNRLSKKYKEIILEQVKAGENAFFITGTTKKGKKLNNILVNRKKLPLAQFHELGHAFNRHNSRFWRTAQKMRIPSLALGIALTLFTAMTRNSKPKNGKELTKPQKLKNFIRNHAGILAIASALPMVLEETVATLRGNRWAKQVLSPDLAKQVAKTNRFGALSYLGVAATLGICATCTKLIKNKIQAKHELKVAQNMQMQ